MAEASEQAVDLAKVRADWLHVCGSCDAGLPMSCTCPVGDPRSVIALLADEVERLRAEVSS